LFFILSILGALGLAVLLVEKGDDWPISFWKPYLSRFLNLFHDRASEMLDCTVCTSFWTALVIDCMIFLLSGGIYFMWPVTGFAACGVTWLIYQILELFDKAFEDGGRHVDNTSIHDGTSED